MSLSDHARRRLDGDLIGWLTTVGNGTPHTSPIWFLWDGETLLVYSRPDKPKLRNISSNPRTGFHLDGDGTGGGIVIAVGTAEIRPDMPPADQVERFTTKYAERIAANGWTPQSFAVDYSVPIVVRPRRWRTW